MFRILSDRVPLHGSVLDRLLAAPIFRSDPVIARHFAEDYSAAVLEIGGRRVRVVVASADAKITVERCSQR